MLHVNLILYKGYLYWHQHHLEFLPNISIMTGKIEEKGAADGSRDHTEDGTVDIKGNPALRSKSGRWKACSFMLGKVLS